MLKNCISQKPSRVLTMETLDEIDKFCYLGSYVSPGDGISNEVSSRIQNASLVFTDLRYLVEFTPHQSGQCCSVRRRNAVVVARRYAETVSVLIITSDGRIHWQTERLGVQSGALKTIFKQSTESK